VSRGLLCSYNLSTVIDPSHTVYGVKGVIAIPLIEDRARIAVNTLASRNALLTRPSLLNSTTIDTISSPKDPLATGDPETEEIDSQIQDTSELAKSSHRVQFSPDDQVKFMTPVAATFEESENAHLRLHSTSSSHSSSSDLSTPSSEYSVTTSPVARTLASRLSFWSRLSKRTSVPPANQGEGQVPTVIVESHSLTQERESLDKIMQEEPAEVLDSILAATAPPPVSVEERHSEMEDKIIRECIKEFTKGGMYFAYNFGKHDSSITPSQLIHRHRYNKVVTT
jgi:hypothetical protein